MSIWHDGVGKKSSTSSSEDCDKKPIKSHETPLLQKLSELRRYYSYDDSDGSGSSGQSSSVVKVDPRRGNSVIGLDDINAIHQLPSESLVLDENTEPNLNENKNVIKTKSYFNRLSSYITSLPKKSITTNNKNNINSNLINNSYSVEIGIDNNNYNINDLQQLNSDKCTQSINCDSSNLHHNNIHNNNLRSDVNNVDNIIEIYDDPHVNTTELNLEKPQPPQQQIQQPQNDEQQILVGLNPDSNSFVFPRVSLKQVGVNTGICNKKGQTQNNNNNNNSGFERCYNDDNKSVRGRTDVVGVSSSHYSTEKSGSSGYYSSNLYSAACSVDEHIYSEPAIENNTANKDQTGYQQKHNKQQSRSQLMQPHRPQHNQNNLIVENNKQANDLQTNIKLLENRLKPFRPLLEKANTNDIDILDDENCANYQDNDIYGKRKSEKLPTIMEGSDGTIPRPIWPNDVDDSLIDINFDAFLLSRDIKDNNKKVKSTCNDNLYNYKCTEYVNSCPENPYHIVSPIKEQPVNGTDAEQKDNSLTNYINKFENNANIQNAKGILEEIREKLIALLEENQSNVPKEEPTAIVNPDEETKNVKKTELKENIKNLKTDVDEYLKQINYESEKEIRQLYTGLSQNRKLVTMRKAFASRGNTLNKYDNSNEVYYQTVSNVYENMRPIQRSMSMSNYAEVGKPSSFGTVYVQDGLNYGFGKPKNESEHRKSNSFRDDWYSVTYSDKNFQMKRKNFVEQNYNLMMTSTDVHCDNNNNNINSNNNKHNKNILTNSETNSSLQNSSLTSSISDNRNGDKQQLKQNLANHRPPNLIDTLGKSINGDKDMILEWHKNKPSIWELYYGTNRPNQTIVKKIKHGRKGGTSIVSYPSSRPESDFTLDLPRAEQLRIKLEKEKQFRQRCRLLTTFFSFVFFLLTVMIVSLILTRGKRMFGSML